MATEVEECGLWAEVWCVSLDTSVSPLEAGESPAFGGWTQESGVSHAEESTRVRDIGSCSRP